MLNNGMKEAHNYFVFAYVLEMLKTVELETLRQNANQANTKRIAKRWELIHFIIPFPDTPVMAILKPQYTGTCLHL